MEQTKVQKLAKALNILVMVTLAVNIVAIVLIPGLLYYDPQNLVGGVEEFVGTIVHADADDIVPAGVFAVVFGWLFLLLEPGIYPVGACVFLLICGVCTAVILRQAHWILNTIQEGNPFQMRNARSMKRAALCCWGISGLAVIRFVWELGMLNNIAPLFTYNALAIPVFFMGGLLFLVMSALFRQAAELKEDQDLTI